MENSALLLAASGALSVVLLSWGASRLFGSPQQLIEERLQAYSRRSTRFVEGPAEATGLRKLVRRLMPRRDAGPRSVNLEGLVGKLARADLKITPGEFRLLTLAAMVAAFLAGLLLFRHPLFAAATLIVGYFAPKWYLGYRERSRLKAFNEQLGDALMLLANTLRSGYGLNQAMEHVGEELSPPLGAEFVRVVREVGLGLSISEALEHLQQRVPSDDLDLVVTAITIQHEVGGNLAEVLDTISHTIRERVRVKGEIRVLTSQQRLSALVITLLPVGLALFLQTTNPDYISVLYTSTCGLVMLLTAILGIVAGFIVMRKITAIEV